MKKYEKSRTEVLFGTRNAVPGRGVRRKNFDMRPLCVNTYLLRRKVSKAFMALLRRCVPLIEVKGNPIVMAARRRPL